MLLEQMAQQQGIEILLLGLLRESSKDIAIVWPQLCASAVVPPGPSTPCTTLEAPNSSAAGTDPIVPKQPL
jgi:hypothetical protein